jgi:hypothetical protein
MNMPDTATKTLIRVMISSFDQPGDVEMGSIDGDIGIARASVEKQATRMTRSGSGKNILVDAQGDEMVRESDVEKRWILEKHCACGYGVAASPW